MMSYVNKILQVDLTKETTSVREFPKELKQYIGGRGLGVKLVYDNGANIDPLSPENIMVFATGPLTGTRAPESGRYCVVSKSPATGTVFDSNSGGTWGSELKFAGFDVVVIKGKAKNPVYLWINDGSAEIKSASEVWGKDVFETTDTLVEEVGDKKAKVACIGLGGEKLANIAAIMNDKARAAGRGGLGAVMGSKNLKAIVVRGHNRPEIANPDLFDSAVKESMETIKNNDVTGKGLPSYGTAVLVNIINEAGILPTRNFQTGVFENAYDISGESMAENLLDRKRACWGCIIGCGRGTSIKEGKYKGESGEGPEYETVWSLGAQCGVKDLNAITKANYLCNQYGIDTISAGSICGVVMEMYEKGKITEKEIGFRANFGDASALVNLVELMCKGSGFGVDMVKGSRLLTEKYGAPELAMQVKGLELPAYDPRGVQGHGLAYATSNRGGCHLRAYMIAPEILGIPMKIDPFATEGKPEMLKTIQDLFAVVDSLILCKFNTFAIGAEEFTKLLNGALGTQYSVEDIMQIGERIWNLERRYNNREGLTRPEDTLPKRLLEIPMPDGPAKGQVNRLNEMLDDYYKVRGWNSNGEVTQEKLKELGLE
ncbi:MAG TPA: aldehyde ferredoxin oxidoreductase [Methanosarcinales archaeon]|nr:aldehyde ferredoxin oxidoreductase [Methanosarcinales archaeon]